MLKSSKYMLSNIRQMSLEVLTHRFSRKVSLATVEVPSRYGDATVEVSSKNNRATVVLLSKYGRATVFVLTHYLSTCLARGRGHKPDAVPFIRRK